MSGGATAITLICGICHIAAEHVPSLWLSPHWRLQEHAWDEHRISPADLQQAHEVAGHWVLPDGRVWMREAQLSEGWDAAAIIALLIEADIVAHLCAQGRSMDDAQAIAAWYARHLEPLANALYELGLVLHVEPEVTESEGAGHDA